MKLLALLIAISFCSAADRRVAITIDDLPRGGDGPHDYATVRVMTEKLLKPIRDQKIPVIGFVNEGHMPAPELRKILDLWLDAGAGLGNHTLSHANFFTTPLDKFEREVIDGESVTRAALAARGKKLEYFRHPFLNVGPNLETKRAFEQFLAARGYRIALSPSTVPIIFSRKCMQILCLKQEYCRIIYPICAQLSNSLNTARRK